MAISVFPIAVTASSSLNANAITAAVANTMYEGRGTFDPAIYTITCASGVVTTFQFMSSVNTVVLSGVTASGTVSVNLSSTADRIRLYTNTGTNTVVTINKTASALSNVFSGTLDTITTTSTYTNTSSSGFGYAVLVGGGGAGGGMPNTGGTSRGGGAGGVGGKLLSLTGSMPVTIGAGGTGVAGATGNSGGQSTFGGMTCGGGGGGDRSNEGATGAVTGADQTGSYPFVKNGTTGAGGTGSSSNNSPGSGSGIGTGGTGRSGAGSAGSGYGAGGGGCYNNTFGTFAGGNGTPGVLYVLRF
jgi:hypothetical protein